MTACKSQDCSDNPVVRIAILQLLDLLFDTPPPDTPQTTGEVQPGGEPEKETKAMESTHYEKVLTPASLIGREP